MIRTTIWALLLFLPCSTGLQAAEHSDPLPAITLLLSGRPGPFIHYPPDTSFTPIPTDLTMPLPAYLEPVTGTVFHNRITRLTHYPDAQANFPYPKTPSWNSDGSLLMLSNRLLDGHTYQTIAAQAWWDDDEKKWSAIYPRIYYGMEHNRDLDGDGKKDHCFVRRDVTPVLDGTAGEPARERLIIFSGAEFAEMLLGKYEGNIDHQDRFVVFAGRRMNNNYLTAIVYDIRARRIASLKEMTDIRWEDNSGGQVLDWISVSPSGRYILINWNKFPEATDEDASYRIDQYDIQLNHIRELAHQGQHGDIGVTANGHDMYVQLEFGGERRGIWGYDLESGAETRLLPDKYNGGHISCRNYRRPGWCYPSTTAEGHREVFALKLDGSGTVNRFAQTHQSDGNSRGGVNADGTRIIFESDWHGTTPVDASNQHVREAFVVNPHFSQRSLR